MEWSVFTRLTKFLEHQDDPVAILDQYFRRQLIQNICMASLDAFHNELMKKRKIHMAIEAAQEAAHWAASRTARALQNGRERDQPQLDGGWNPSQNIFTPCRESEILLEADLQTSLAKDSISN